jgi:hypothetical protein
LEVVEVLLVEIINRVTTVELVLLQGQVLQLFHALAVAVAAVGALQLVAAAAVVA